MEEMHPMVDAAMIGNEIVAFFISIKWNKFSLVQDTEICTSQADMSDRFFGL